MFMNFFFMNKICCIYIYSTGQKFGNITNFNVFENAQQGKKHSKILKYYYNLK